MTTTAPSKKQLATVLFLFAFPLTGALACGKGNTGAGMVPDASVTTTVADAGAVAVADINSCTACQQGASAPQTWTFAGIYSDPQCTVPLAQMVAASCAQIPSVGPVSLTYSDEVGVRKANEAAQVTLTEQVAPEAPRFRKAGTACVKANEGAVALTPINCGGFRVCRDANGTLTCSATSCRTLSNGCPDFEETRMYAGINDPGMKTATGGGGGGNLARLKQCCNALAAEAKRLGASPEAGMINTAAQQCTALVAQAGPTGTAPELGAIRTMLAGRNVPAVCAGF